MRLSALCATLLVMHAASAQFYTVVETYAGTGNPGMSNGPLASSTFQTPYSLCYDGATETFYVADAQNHAIRKITGGVVSTLAGNGSSGDVDGTGSSARFYVPTGIDYHNGYVYVSDNGNHKIKRIDAATGATTTLVGTGFAGTNDGPALVARLYNPTEVRVASNGDVYISDYGNHSIRKLTGGIVSTFAGLSGSSGDVLGTGTVARFNRPTGIAFGSGGFLFVADQVNCKIKAIDPNGTVTLVAGSGALASIDGVGTGASFTRPTYIAWDPLGALMVAEWMGNKIRRVQGNGTVTTVAGTGASGYLDGPALSATFNSPYGICVDNDGNAYIGDKENHVIRKLVKQGEIGIDEPVAGTTVQQVIASPNPTSSVTTIDLSHIPDPLTGLLIYDEKGALVVRKEQGDLAGFGRGAATIDATGWPAGQYAVLVSTRSCLYRSVFIKE
ncbi:MAG: hypothetical protein IPG74_11780 [Flavobacteriales bacterium]|nr:hypothetical protein [Flavobacteriales bacterium]